MNLRELLLEKIDRTGKGETAVVGWGRGMGHKGHMYLASSVITHAKQVGGDPYFVVSRTVGRDDPITPEEKLTIYRKVFPDAGHIFQTASDEMPDLTRVLTNLNQQGYRNVVVIVGADQVKAFQYLKQYNGKPDKAGNVAFNFDNLDVISRQETSDPSREEEGPRATPMRQVLLDPSKSEEEQFAVWRDAMNPEVSDDEVRDLMNKAKERMISMAPAPKKAAAKKKVAEPAVAEGFSDVVKGIKRKVAGKEDPKEVEHTYGRIARSAIKHKTPDQAEKDIKRWEKVNKVVNKQRVAEGVSLKQKYDDKKRTDQNQVRYGKMTQAEFDKKWSRTDRPKSTNKEQDVDEATSAAVRLGRAVQRTQGKTAASQARSVIPSSIPKKEEPKKTDEASYPGNIGIMELIKFFNKAKDTDPELVKRVKELIADHEDKAVWDIIQKYTGVKLKGREFNESISESIKREANRLRNK